MVSVNTIIKILTASVLLLIGMGAQARVIPAIKKSSNNIGLIFVQGMQVDVNAYESLAIEIQQQSNPAVWVAMVNFPLSLPNPLLYSKITDQARKELKAAGMPGDLYYVIGHSVGGTIAQSQEVNLRGGVVGDNSVGINPPRIHGLILLNSYVTRNNQFILGEIPILTLGGELDGLTRIGRLAEAYARQIDMAPNFETAALKSPVVVLPGVNHRHSFTGPLPLTVAKRDLDSPLPAEESRHEIARVIGAFLGTNLLDSAEDTALLRQYVVATSSLVRPLIDAMWLEGSYHLLTPCTSKRGEAVDQNHCQKGSHWAEYAAKLMAGDIPNITYQVENVFHESWRMFPFFHPHILNACLPGTPCVMRLDNVAQNVYSSPDGLDISIDPVAAVEMRVKMSSRQSILFAAGSGVQKFSTTDEWDVCAAINQKALEWAETHAPANTLQRYREFGLPIVMGADLPQSNGPGFIWSPIQKKTIKRDDGSKVMQIKVQTMRTPLDESVKSAAGYHFCKLISPAWFMEWIYTDSLRT